jgi:hypothetical protein
MPEAGGRFENLTLKSFSVCSVYENTRGAYQPPIASDSW